MILIIYPNFQYYNDSNIREFYHKNVILSEYFNMHISKIDAMKMPYNIFIIMYNN